MKTWNVLLLTGLFMSVGVIFGGKLFIEKIQYGDSNVTAEVAVYHANNYDEEKTPYVVLGNSQALALDPLQLQGLTGKRFINISSSGNDETAMLSLLRRTLKNGKPKKVFVQLSPTTFGALYRTQDVAFRAARYFFSKKEAQHYEQNKYRKDIYALWQQTRFLQPRYFNLRFDKLTIKGLKTTLERKTKVFMTKTMKHHRGFFLYKGENEMRKTLQNGIADFAVVDGKTDRVKDPKKPYESGEKTKTVMVQLEQLLEENGIEYAYFWSPEHVSLHDQNQIQTWQNPIKRIIPALNQSAIGDFIFLPQDHFIDTAHLNYVGSRAFGRAFAQQFLDPEIQITPQTTIIPASQSF